jgi:chromosome segregation ATPase
MSLGLKLDKKRIRCQSLVERVSDLEKVCSELYDQLQDSVTVSSKLESDNKMLRVQLDAMRGDKNSSDWIRDKLEMQVGRSKALEDALAEIRRQLIADRQQLAVQADKCQQLEQRLVEKTEESVFMQKEYDRQKNRCDMLEQDCERLDSLLTLAKEKISVLNAKIVDIQGNIRVICRVRPILPEEWEKYNISESALNESIKYPDYNTLEFDGSPFEFDRVLPPSSKQRDLFEEVESVVRSVMNGVNACVMA